MTIQAINHIIDFIPDPDALWSGSYKIPWHEPDFSRRMLAEHLSQDHELASRRREDIAATCAWICSDILREKVASILDLGCGPGLYSHELSRTGHHCLGIDFGPASVEYAARNFASENCRFELADVLEADYSGPHDLVMMLYGEINVFSPRNARCILEKARASLVAGGRLLLECQRFEAVRDSAQGTSWRAAPSGLFSGGPHLCLTRGHWFEEQGTALQVFHVLESSGEMRTHFSTTRAWSEDEYRELLEGAGFGNVVFHEQWPGSHPGLLAVIAEK